MYVAYDKECEVFFETDKIVFFEISTNEWNEIAWDEDRQWKSPAEIMSSNNKRKRFEVMEDGTLFYY